MLKIMNRLSKIWITSNGYVTLNMFENLILLFPPSTILSHYSILHESTRKSIARIVGSVEFICTASKF